uniref:Uncharacterized protein n=1 Tax=Anguilla anguilla TaxID=7936 RepID=A0A0E9PFS0_ANGAN
MHYHGGKCTKPTQKMSERTGETTGLCCAL